MKATRKNIPSTSATLRATVPRSEMGGWSEARSRSWGEGMKKLLVFSVGLAVVVLTA